MKCTGKNLQEDSDKMKQYYDSKVRAIQFSVNDIVWLKDESNQGLPRRLQKKYVGPYQINRFLTEGYSVILRNLITGDFVKNKVHVD